MAFCALLADNEQVDFTGVLFMQPRILASAIYLFYFAAGGALSPFLNLYYQSVGMTKPQIGVLVAATMLMTIVASALWSTLADALRLHRYILPLAIMGTIAPVGLLMRSTEFLPLLLLVLSYAFFMGPVMALTDNAVLEMLGADRTIYGRLRIWGAVGFGLSAWAGGVLAERMGLSILFVLFMGLMFVCGLLTTRLPAPHIDTSEPFLRNLRRLSTNMTWLGFLAVLLLVGFCSSLMHNYFVLYMTEMGVSESLYGFSVALAGVSELPVFFFSAFLLRRLSPRGLLMVAFVTFALRLLVISLIPGPNWVIVPQLMHGLSFSALWVAGVIYMAQIAPPGLGATAQSSFGVIFFGVAGATGGLVGANLYDTLGPVVLFRIGALVALLGLGLFVFSTRAPRLRSTHVRAVQK